MSKKTISWNQLREYLANVQNPANSCRCNYEKYFEWMPFDRAHKTIMNNLGRMDDNGHKPIVEEYPVLGNTAKDDPMPLGYYPYNGCDIYECKECKRLNFVYTELGGHVPEERRRVIREELLIFVSPYHS